MHTHTHTTQHKKMHQHSRPTTGCLRPTRVTRWTCLSAGWAATRSHSSPGRHTRTLHQHPPRHHPSSDSGRASSSSMSSRSSSRSSSMSSRSSSSNSSSRGSNGQSYSRCQAQAHGASRTHLRACDGCRLHAYAPVCVCLCVCVSVCMCVRACCAHAPACSSLRQLLRPMLVVFQATHTCALLGGCRHTGVVLACVSKRATPRQRQPCVR
jgi:hypothetical protein